MTEKRESSIGIDTNGSPRQPKRITFTVLGNQIDPEYGNPIGYTRQTYRSKWTPKAKRYAAWQDYVWACLRRDNLFCDVPRYRKAEQVVVECYITYSSELGRKRPDPGNVTKGIADALADRPVKMGGRIVYYERRLYPNDKDVLERTQGFDYAEQPRVEVSVFTEER